MSLSDLMFFATRCRAMTEREYDHRMRAALLYMAQNYDHRACKKSSE